MLPEPAVVVVKASSPESAVTLAVLPKEMLYPLQAVVMLGIARGTGGANATAAGKGVITG